MRNPNSRNPWQQSVYVSPHDWERARQMAHLKGTTISGFIVGLIKREAKRLLKEKKDNP